MVTGGSKGIGRAIILQLVEDHDLYALINYSHDEKAAKETLRAVQELGGEGDLLRFPVQEKEKVDDCLANWHQSHPDHRIQVLVNNAGIARDRLLMWMEEPDWDDVMNVSAKGLYNVTRAVIRSMLKHRDGRIINITSLSGAKGLPGQMNYAAAKAAMIGATKALAQEIGKRNITVNAVAPGFIQTDMLEEVDIKQRKSMIPLGRVGKPEEVAHAVSFLASDKASYITGEVLHINGGLFS